jgi:hypothetical protein
VGDERMVDVTFRVRNRGLSSVPLPIAGIPFGSTGAVKDEMMNGVTTMGSLGTKAGWTSLVGSIGEVFECSKKVERRRIGQTNINEKVGVSPSGPSPTKTEPKY